MSLSSSVNHLLHLFIDRQSENIEFVELYVQKKEPAQAENYKKVIKNKKTKNLSPVCGENWEKIKGGVNGDREGNARQANVKCKWRLKGNDAERRVSGQEDKRGLIHQQQQI